MLEINRFASARLSQRTFTGRKKMDAKITKKRLLGMLSYDWIKIIAVICGGIFFWVIVFTTTATRITPSQNFYVYNYKVNRTLSNKFHNHLDNAFQKGLFSYEVVEYNVGDLVAAGDYTSTLLDARMSVSEGDIMFIPNIPDPDYAITDTTTNETIYPYTCLEAFVATYRSVLYELDGENGYFTQMEKFLNGYYGGDYKTGTLDEAKVKADFRERVKKNKDKRFKKEAQIEQGANAEVERIQKYKTALEEFNAYLGAGIISFTQVTMDVTEEIQVQGNFAINLCPDEEKLPLLKEYVSYVTEKENPDGSTANVYTAQNMNVTIFKFSDVEESFEYEAVLYLVDLIKNCLPTAN